MIKSSFCGWHDSKLLFSVDAWSWDLTAIQCAIKTWEFDSLLHWSFIKDHSMEILLALSSEQRRYTNEKPTSHTNMTVEKTCSNACLSHKPQHNSHILTLYIKWKHPSGQGHELNTYKNSDMPSLKSVIWFYFKGRRVTHLVPTILKNTF